jgi:hypothetical protein
MSDYEAVFGSILDFAAERPEVDDERIALSGRSFGGYLGSRAACFESSARAVIADPGQYDRGAQVRRMLSPQLWVQVEASAPEAEEKFAEMLESDPQREYYFMSRAVTHGAKSARNTCEYCRTTVCPRARSQCRRWSPHNQTTPRPDDSTITSEKMLVEFDPDAARGATCEGVALSRYDQVVHDWLDGVLAS